ncbi:hypothetical protein U1Q18_009310 [Sarracenia purpurea var. burkii]
MLEVISLTEELLETARQSENSGLDILTNVDASSDLHNAWVTSQRDKEPINMSDLSDKFPVGTKVQAVWSEDVEWYNVTIEAVTSNGYDVCYEEWVVTRKRFAECKIMDSIMTTDYALILIAAAMDLLSQLDCACDAAYLMALMPHGYGFAITCL